MRGMLSDEIQTKAKEFLGEEIDQEELRLYPYIDHCIKNGGRLDPSKLSIDEFYILNQLIVDGHIKISNDDKIEISYDFYKYMQEILWLSYVEYKLNKEG